MALSRGGADAQVQREFDISNRAFVHDGFQLPEAKNAINWIDRDCVFVGTDFGAGSTTESGNPRIVRRWQRAKPLADAQTMFEGDSDDVSVYAWHDPTPGWERDFIRQNTSFYTNRLFEVVGSDPGEIIKPADAVVDVFKAWILLILRSSWQVVGRTYTAGSVLVADYQQYLETMRFAETVESDLAAGSVPEFEVLFEPSATTSLQTWPWTQDHLVLNILDNVRSRIDVKTPILFTTSTRDDRVHPGHARKMAHALMEAGKEVSYYENIEGGHGGSANNQQMAYISALEFRFLWQVLGGAKRVQE